MYHDRNTYIMNQSCEFCGEQLRMYEKIIFPLRCQNNAQNTKRTKFNQSASKPLSGIGAIAKSVEKEVDMTFKNDVSNYFAED